MSYYNDSELMNKASYIFFISKKLNMPLALAKHTFRNTSKNDLDCLLFHITQSMK